MSTSITSSSSSSASTSASSVVPLQARFDGRAESFPHWKFNMSTLLNMKKLYDVVDKPHPREVRAAAASAASASSGQPSAAAAADASAIQDAADQLWDERAS